MGPGVVANGMAGGDDRVVNGRIFFNILAKAEKSSFGIMFGQQLQDTGGGSGMGSVIKGKVNGLLFTGKGEADPGEQVITEFCKMASAH